MNITVYRFNILIVNSGGAGSTCIIKKYCHDYFSALIKPTIGADFDTKNINILGHSIDLLLWDVSYTELYNNVIYPYYQPAIAAVVVFDLSRFDSSLKNTLGWMKKIDEVNFKLGKTRFPCILVGNKADLIPEEDLPKINDKIKIFF